jgi:putative DNA primase/helicase
MEDSTVSASQIKPSQTKCLRPTALPVIAANIPEAIKALPQWVCWRFSFVEGKWTKAPVTLTDTLASSTDPNTWATFEEALEAFPNVGGDGIGFVFSADDPYVGIDLDDCRDPDTGAVQPWAKDIVLRLATYAEVSPSGTGIKLWAMGKKPGKKCRTKYEGGEVEIYDRARYFCATGCRLQGMEAIRPNAQDDINWLYGKLFPTKTSAKTKSYSHVESDDADLLAKARRADNGAKFAALFDHGDASRHGNDDSRADAALCSMLAFWTNKDAGRMDRLFRQSALYREKWERQDYRDRTVEFAVENCTETFGAGASVTLNGRCQPGEGKGDAWEGDDQKQSATAIILQFFRDTYRPIFKRAGMVVCEDGRQVTASEACATPCTVVIDRLANAEDAPRYKGGAVNRGSLPTFFRSWSRVAWGDLLGSLPDEDTAELGENAPAREEFRRLMRDLMVTEFTLGDVVVHGGPQVQRCSLIDWCYKFAKPGPWKSIRSKSCWTKTKVTGDGELRLLIAIRHEVCAQLRGDRRLIEMEANTFTRRCERYGIGSTSERDRPHGKRAVILSFDFVEDLLHAGPRDETEAENLPDFENGKSGEHTPANSA